MILDAAETVLGTFGFERTVYGDSKKRNGKWGQELVEEIRKDILIILSCNRDHK